ncbi:Protein CBR-SRH-10 [Caenorhabditis briggsae]|uniref:Protein CBR-SRH-10 n=3 Tax=Caenorhabditis briggsae TaxID=6238 RepID=A8X9I5_CAEBR|nr:Protein CBR-SRH-10 [Caenorhabditis briggsae]CAP29297.2 Protein CBR-SRH-10 [Caenorhabditis briggsae]
MCKKPAPIGYNMSLTGAHLVAFPIYVMAFYTLYAEKSPNFKVYKKYLATHVVSNFLFELHLSVVMKPILYLPYPTIRMSGAFFLSYINGFISFIIFYFFIASTGWSILELLYFRFKLIYQSNVCSRWVKQSTAIVKGSRRTLVVFSGCTFCFLGLCITGIFEQTKYKLKLEIINEFPELLCTSAITLPKTSNAGIKPIHLFNVFVLISTIVGTFLCATMGIVSFLALDEMVRESRSSLRTISMHRAFLVSLFCQIGVHGIMMGFPLFIYIVSILFHFDGNEVGYVAIVLASLHGAMSTLAMILFNRPLFQIAKSKAQSLFFPRTISVGDVSLVSSSLTRPNDSVQNRN